MKRKLILILSFLLTMYFMISYDIINIQATNISNIKIQVKTDENIDLSQIEFQIYDNINKSNFNIQYYDEILLDKVYLNNNGIKVINLSNCSNLSIMINVDSIPLGYAIDKKVIYENETNNYIFNLLKIENIICNIDENGNSSVHFISNNEEVYTNYEIEYYFLNDFIDNVLYYKVNVITDCDNIFDMVIDFSNYNEDLINQYLQNINYFNNTLMMLNDDISDDDDNNIYVDDEKYSNYTLFAQSSIYQIYCDTTNEDDEIYQSILAPYILECFEAAEDFYVDELKYNRPVGTGDNAIHIYLYLYDSYTDYICNGVTYPSYELNHDDKVYFQIEVGRKPGYSSTNLNYILYTCFNEYFHGVHRSYLIDDRWLSEPSATFMSLYYVDVVKNLNCYPLENKIADFVNEFLNQKNHIQHTATSYIDDSTYGSMILFVYVYEKTDDITFMKDIVISQFNKSDKYETIYKLAEYLNMEHDDFISEFFLYASFPKLKFTKINTKYTNLWYTSTNPFYNNYNHKIKDNTFMLYRLENSEDVSKLVNYIITIPTNSKLRFYLIRNDNNLYTTYLQNTNGISVKFNGITLKNENIYILAINCNEPLETFQNFTLSYETSDITNKISIGFNDNKIYQLSDYLEGNEEVIKMETTNTGYYLFEILNMVNVPKGVLELYDLNFNLLGKNDFDLTNYSKTYKNATTLVSYIPSSINIEGEYIYPSYVRIKRYGSDIIGINLKVTDTINKYDINTSEFTYNNTNHLLFEKDINNISGDGFISIENDIIGEINLDISITNIVDNIKLYIIEKNSNSYIISEHTYTFTEEQSSRIIDLSCYYNKDILIVYTNCYENNISFSFDLTYNFDFTIVLDKEGVDNSLVGSEVRLNNGVRETNTIMIGMTRCAFLGNDAPEESRLKYNWYSSNDKIIKISEYGTLTALKPGSVLIQAINKISGEKSAIYVTSYVDTNTEIINITLTTDMRSDSSIVGTEVSSGAGVANETTIHLGNNRLISLGDNAPSNIIQDYIWTSSNNNILKISEFGTMLTYGTGNVVITGAYKYNTRFIGTITISVIN